MSETVPKPSLPEASHAPYVAEAGFGGQLALGLEKASEQGFDLQTAIRAGYGEAALDNEVVQQRTEEVLTLSAQMAEDMQLRPEFFERAANTVMLTAIAESWLTNVDRAVAPNADRQIITKERETLVDIASMLAGQTSAEVEAVSAVDSHSHDRYIQSAETEDRKAFELFLDEHVNNELSQSVAAIFGQEGGHSFLAKQREALGLTGETEEKFVVKVLNLAEDLDFYVTHIQPKPEYPDWINFSELSEEEKNSVRTLSAEVDIVIAQNEAESKPMLEAMEDYDSKFGQIYGELAPAFVSREQNGKNELFIRAPQAMALVKFFNTGEMPDDKDVKDDIERIFALIRHEYGHTQKSMTVGPHVQLGLILEERKAEYISGDKHGYTDIKNLMMDLSFATDTKLVSETLDGALKELDPASAFVSRASQQIGLRNTLLLMALKPLPYDKNPAHAKQFANLTPSQTKSDKSTLEIPIRETIDRMGDNTLRESFSRWAQEIEDEVGLTDFHEEFYPNYREGHGLGISAKIIREEVATIRDKRAKANDS